MPSARGGVWVLPAAGWLGCAGNCLVGGGLDCRGLLRLQRSEIKQRKSSSFRTWLCSNGRLLLISSGMTGTLSWRSQPLIRRAPTQITPQSTGPHPHLWALNGRIPGQVQGLRPDPGFAPPSFMPGDEGKYFILFQKKKKKGHNDSLI